ncbi:asparagine synthase (glutamine-hydrolyzing) [Aeromonas dhakensis]|uniref:asparagine synthase (glutamine-hydrolyzing) n=3 Tax=Aeromonas TaxID=642 RepID=A0A068FVD5_AERHY|nr:MULTISPECIES: asparagine synthase (glutamine-hydrolyzing) [Aeromonas]AID71071.1 asparagine synthetase, glutamine-hydrolyzing [Aeromonas hydrophila]AJQ55330.1 asparagine synthase [Aeromonas hydrophila]EIM1708194.1 asparagine synthase (glutamine-hydrolyzing) [Aeromonas dhakensis]MBO2901051.1 asparagine synthase (glutamine-hydrolyzing) [Aeromonas dhakensis]MBO2995838.1 asparagine synthase (glutamine-hydrolyzing) [Aeromonas dhakensis]
MCGFAGFYNDRSVASDAFTILDSMGKAIIERGPDSAGIWYSSEDSIGFVHRRLAIVDLSEAGHQPMTSNTGRYILSYNGEVYNHEDLRCELEEISPREWRGHSDTETLLAAIEQWGLKITLQKATGMFSLALWDTQSKKLQLARDRFGEKPLYYGWLNDVFLFGSQLNALRCHPMFQPEIDRDSITLLLRHNYIPAPYSIYKDVYKLLPGSILTLEKEKRVDIETYWSARDVMSHCRASEDTAPVEEQLATLEKTLKKAVARQMVADVPLGAFLSGGVDSSLVVALMQAQSTIPVKTFSIGFDDPRFNEAEFAKSVAKHLGTEHTELYVTAEDALAVVPKLADIYDEPFSDSSQIPTFLVSQIARQHVTVSLSGDAGDELFCGYNRYLLTARLWNKIDAIPIILRRILGVMLTIIPVKSWNSISKIFPMKAQINNFGDKLHKAAAVLTCRDVEELYLGLVSHWQKPEEIVLGSKEPKTVLTDPERKAKFSDPILQMMAQDTLSYLPDDILVKVDRAAMAVSLETRVPFLDHEVLEHAWRLPKKLKLNEGQSKWCLRQILYRYVPKNLIERPKMGFAVPLDSWLRGPLREWAEDLIDEKRLLEEGFFNAGLVQKMWQEHLSGKRNWQYQLWDILMFQAWYQRYHK